MRFPVAAISGSAIVVGWAAILLDTLAQFPGALLFGTAALVFFLILQTPHFGRFTWTHLTIGASFAVATFLIVPDPGPVFGQGLGRALFVAVLFAALGTLREAAHTSAAILKTGRMLVLQQPGRRYFAIAGGGTLFGAILNFGVIPLIGGMITDSNSLAAAGGDTAVREDREKRMMLALLRGFSVVMLWCPLTLAFAIATATVSGSDWRIMFAVGLVASALVIGSGWVVDRIFLSRPAPQSEAVPFEWTRLLPLVGLLVAVSLLAVLVEETTAGQLIHGVILVVPLMAVAWLIRDGGLSSMTRLSRYIVQQVPAQRGEIAVLANAAFVGTMVAALVPQGAVDMLLGQNMVPAFMIAPTALIIVIALGLLGANSLITVTALASIVASPDRFGVDPSVFAAALVMGWGLNVGSSPAAAATMIVGRLTGQGSFTIGCRWNGAHTWVATLLCCMLLIGLHYLI
jgi:hypothetical protein